MCFQFLTINQGDEKAHLVPVLNTMLKLSPEETQKLQLVAKGKLNKIIILFTLIKYEINIKQVEKIEAGEDTCLYDLLKNETFCFRIKSRIVL